MARDPGSVWAPLPEAGAPDGYHKTQFIVHSTGDNGSAAAIARYFGGPTPNESTFIVGWGPHDPTLQIMDSTDRADANTSASIRAIAVEVVGDGVGGYNAWQRSEIIRIGRWAREEHPGILPRVCPAHDQAGYGWHVMFGAPGPWTSVAKVCPGEARIHQLKTDIFPAIFTDTEDNDMLPDERAALLNLASLNGTHFAPALGRIDAAVSVMFTALGALGAKIDAIAEHSGLSAEAIEKAVAQALKDNVVQVDVDVHAPAAKG